MLEQEHHIEAREDFGTETAKMFTVFKLALAGNAENNTVVFLSIMRILGSLRFTTATGDENVTSKPNFAYHKSFAITQSRSRPTTWAKYPKNKLVRTVSCESRE